MLTLSAALRANRNSRIAFVGAGGKTSAMFQVARDLAPALVTTSTHLGDFQASLADRHIAWAENSSFPLFNEHLQSGVTLVTAGLDEQNGRLRGLDPLKLQELQTYASSHSIPLLIEADGSRRKPLKAPGEHEPAIPGFVDVVVVVSGLAGLYQTINDDNIHRAQLFSQLSGLALEEPVTPAALGRVLAHSQGGLKNIPQGAHKVSLLNQADTFMLQAQANELGGLLEPVFDSVIVCTLQPSPARVFSVRESIAAIVLAAGASTRFGQSKQLLEFHGQPFVRVVASTALQAGLAPVVVVCGADAQNVAAALTGLPVLLVHNSHWQQGQSTSIRAGLAAIPSSSGGALFLMADQPQVSAEVLRALVERHSQDLPAVLAPYVFDERAHPFLFDRLTFQALSELQGDTGAKVIFSKYSPRYVNWYDRRLLLDIDTPEDYQKLLDSDLE